MDPATHEPAKDFHKRVEPAPKEDAEEVKNIATGEGSLKTKAKAAGEAIKDPGAPGEQERKPPE
jgi:hypothetical protein